MKNNTVHEKLSSMSGVVFLYCLLYLLAAQLVEVETAVTQVAYAAIGV